MAGKKADYAQRNRSRRAQGPARSALNQGPQDLERPLVDIPSGFERFEVSECLRIPRSVQNRRPLDVVDPLVDSSEVRSRRAQGPARSVQNHEFNLTALKKVFAIIIPQTLLFHFIEYLGIPFIILLFCLILCIILEKYMPGLYNLISGGRRDIKVSK